MQFVISVKVSFVETSVGNTLCNLHTDEYNHLFFVSATEVCGFAHIYDEKWPRFSNNISPKIGRSFRKIGRSGDLQIFLSFSRFLPTSRDMERYAVSGSVK